MASSRYRVTPAQIGNSSGLRLPAAFYRDHPQFTGAPGQMEVLSDDTMLLRFEPSERQGAEPEDESLMLGLFLDLLTRQALTAAAGPAPYTEAMAAEDDELLAGVTVDATEIAGAPAQE
jgi:antitoxin PrlF